jgi:SAM-dependent methyltransferase
MDTAADYWDRTAGVYDEAIDRVFGNTMRSRIRDRLAGELELGRTVEFGCGTGYYTPVLAERSAGVAATDISEAMLGRARERLQGISGIAVSREDCTKTSFADASFDTAFFGLSFHFTDGPATLAEMRRILRPGGTLILAIPTLEGLSLHEKIRGILRNLRGFGRLSQPGTRIYTSRSIGPLLAGAGFRPDEIALVTDPEHPGGFAGLWVRAVRC